jgi:hypothetical protein
MLVARVTRLILRNAKISRGNSGCWLIKALLFVASALRNAAAAFGIVGGDQHHPGLFGQRHPGDEIGCSFVRGELPILVKVEPTSGSQYCAYDYQKKLQAYGLRPSMSGKDNCYDNASVETFFKRSRPNSSGGKAGQHAVRLKPLSSGTSMGSTMHAGATHILAA